MWSDTLTAKEIALDNCILRGVVGSTVHGTNIEGTDDRDEMGVCIEPPDYVIGLKTFEQYIQRDQPEGVRSKPGDLDLTIYSLRKWVKLALKGNPSVLLLLYTPQLVLNSTFGQSLRDLAPSFASKRSAKPFLGFVRQQTLKLNGDIGQLRVNRPELVEAYGYDTKYAGHIIRLGYQGIEYLSTGELSLPMQDAERNEVLDIRLGKWSLEQVLRRSDELVREIENLEIHSPLPAEPETEWVEEWLIEAYRNWWERDFI